MAAVAADRHGMVIDRLARRVHTVRHLHAVVFGGRRGQADMAERTTQRRHRQREAEKQEQEPVENTCHEKESIAYDAEQSS